MQSNLIVLAVSFLSVHCHKPLLELKDSCSVARTNSLGTCEFVENCPYVIEEIKQRSQFPTLCGFEGKKEIICCPITQPITNDKYITESRISKRASERKCEEYCESFFFGNITNSNVEDKVLECFTIKHQSRTVGNIDVESKELPHMALLGYDDVENNSIKWNCSGSLISENFVLTAAQCANTKFGIVKYVMLGAPSTERVNGNADPIQYNVIGSIVHPNYQNGSIRNDIALLRIETVQFNEFIRPICLANRTVNPQRAQASGWGKSHSNSHPTGAQLLKYDLDVVSNDECKSVYQNHTYASFTENLNNETQICAGSTIYRRDVCQGDSGGPLQMYHDGLDCMFTLIGVAAFGQSCSSGFLGAFTIIFPNLEWIESVVWPGN